MEGRVLRVAVPPEANEYQLDDAEDAIYSQIVAREFRESVALLDLLANRLNFTYQLIFSDRVGLGLQQDDGSFNGLLGLLQDQKIDLIASRVPFLPHLRDSFDLSIPLGQEEWVTLQQQPPFQHSPGALFTPFEASVWLLVALSVICIIPIMYIIYRLYMRFVVGRTLLNKETPIHFSDYVLFVTVSLLRQNHTLQVKIDSQRLLMATWWIVGTVLTTFYTANLTAELARPVQATTIQHPNELSLREHRHLQWLTIQGGTLHALTRTENGYFWNDMAKDLQMGRGRTVGSIYQAVRLVEKEGYVWFGSRHTQMEILLAKFRANNQDNATQSQSCTFVITDKRYLSVEYGMAFHKNSSLTAIFNRALKMIDQAGLAKFIQRPTFTGVNPCSSVGSKNVRAMQTGDLIGLFYIFVAGLSLSSLAFVGEKIGSRSHPNWRRIHVKPNSERTYGQTTVKTKAVVDVELDTLADQIDQILRNSLLVDYYK